MDICKLYGCKLGNAEVIASAPDATDTATVNI